MPEGPHGDGDSLNLSTCGGSHETRLSSLKTGKIAVYIQG